MGLLQGLTEWLPVSSSGHLVLAQHFFNVEERTLFDAILHLGTLFAMTIYFRSDIKVLLTFKKPMTFKVIIASIPIIMIGFIFNDWIEAAFASAMLVSIFLVINGCVLIFNGFIKPKEDQNNNEQIKELQNNDSESKTIDVAWKHSILIGLFQIFALLPGISRSGTTITTGRTIGLDWRTAAKFSFFISFLPVAGAAWFKILTDWQDFQTFYLLGFVVAFIVGYITIEAMMRILQVGKFHYFGIYTIIIGVFMLSFVL
jgi:undecaprenyl-diphosphatase